MSASRAPRAAASFDEVRTRITADHAVLRGLTGALAGAARASLLDEKERFIVRSLLGQLCAEVERHLAFEETSLVPFLKARAAAHLVSEHGAQRSILLALTEEAEYGACETVKLTDDIVWFVERFERDLAEEEQGLVTLATAPTLLDQTA